MSLETPRQIAARVLGRHAAGREFLEPLLAEELDRAGLTGPDRHLAEELCLGVVRWQGALDWLIAQKTEGRRQPGPIQILLRLGLYQLFWLDRVPDHAAVHQTVELAKSVGPAGRAAFVNAVLRRCLRERAQVERQLEELKRHQPAVAYSHPAWLCERWTRRWGAEACRTLLEWNNRPAVNFARVNTLRTQAGTLATRWQAEGVEAEPRQFPWTPAGLVFELKSHPPLATLPSFQEGLFYIQDPSTLLAPLLLAPLPGETVLDLCAAPGGKTTLLAQLMQDRGRVVARDIQPDRLARLRENCARLGLSCVEVQAGAPETGAAAAGGPFDRVLVDAPCSNTGVLRRRVDARRRLRPDDLAVLAQRQRELLRAGLRQLKPGGRLVYSTCSLEPEENREVVEAILAEWPAARLAEERQLTPMTDGVDGAYVARLELGATTQA